MAIESIVDTTSPDYPIIKGKPFQDFNIDEVFKEVIEKFFPGLFHFSTLKFKKYQNYTTGILFKCHFSTNPLSSFYIYVNVFQPYSGHDNQLRCQPRGIKSWQSVDNSEAHYAEDFTNAVRNNESLDNKECYCIGLYKQSNESEDILFVGMPPHRMIKMEEARNNSSSTSQINVYDMRCAYQNDMHICYNSSNNLFAFKPKYLLWYMMNRDSIHNQILVEKNQEYYTVLETDLKNQPLQQIFYGAPGTGKSRKINDITSKFNFIRTTFHPDSDYASFVGSFKPSISRISFSDTEKATLRYGKGWSDVDVFNASQPQITYKFTKQAFLKAYVNAWKLFKKGSKKQCQPQFLIIEEINRGNCAQIFGDIFQLLDRKNGFSEYPIETDEELRKSLLDPNDEFSFGPKGLDLSNHQKAYINSIYRKSETDLHDIASLICSGEVLVLPSNFYIWATMNTSDQSLYPMDTAFKRRWSWKYQPIINPPGLNYRIKFDYKDEQNNQNSVDEDWWIFVQAINKIISKSPMGEGKKIGYLFCNPSNGNEIDEFTLVNKVIFYLWNEIYKDDTSVNSPFMINNQIKTFDDFFTDANELNILSIRQFLNNVNKVSK